MSKRNSLQFLPGRSLMPKNGIALVVLFFYGVCFVAGTVEIVATTMGGETTTVSVSRDETVTHWIAKISEQLNVPRERIVLMYGSRKLVESNAISDIISDASSSPATMNVDMVILQREKLDLGDDTLSEIRNTDINVFPSRDKFLKFLEETYADDERFSVSGFRDIPVTILAKLLSKMSHLRHLDLRGGIYRWHYPECEALFFSLKEIKQLQHLDLSWNSIDSDAVRVLAGALKHMKKLQHLDLGHNDIDGDAVRDDLAYALEEMKQLQHLDLGHNDFDSDAIRNLAPALKEMTQLRHLDLSCNYIGPDGARVLAPALNEMKQLQHLDLKKNLLGDNAYTALAEMLTVMDDELEYLEFGKNGMKGELERVLKQKFVDLKFLEISGRE